MVRHAWRGHHPARASLRKSQFVAVTPYSNGSQTCGCCVFGGFFFFKKKKKVGFCGTRSVNRREPAHGSPQGPPGMPLPPSGCNPGDEPPTSLEGHVWAFVAVTGYLLLCFHPEFKRSVILHEHSPARNLSAARYIL